MAVGLLTHIAQLQSPWNEGWTAGLYAPREFQSLSFHAVGGGCALISSIVRVSKRRGWTQRLTLISHLIMLIAHGQIYDSLWYVIRRSTGHHAVALLSMKDSILILLLGWHIPPSRDDIDSRPQTQKNLGLMAQHHPETSVRPVISSTFQVPNSLHASRRFRYSDRLAFGKYLETSISVVIAAKMRPTKVLSEIESAKRVRLSRSICVDDGKDQQDQLQ